MRINAPPTLIGRLNVHSAVEEEATSPPPDLPSRVLDQAIASHLDEAASLLEGRFQSGLEVTPAQTIMIPKTQSSFRPLTILSFEERVLFRTLVQPVQETFGPLIRSFEEREKVIRAPLDVPKTRYVVVADVASFYEFADHELLGKEIIAQSGDAEIADILGQFLGSITDQTFGLPQLFQGSHILSEVLIRIAERRLVRRGFQVFRFNDDFRLAVRNYQDIFIALETLEAELRRIGLVLNSGKTQFLKKENYRMRIEDSDQQWERITSEVKADLAQFDWYGMELVRQEQEGEHDEEQRDLWITAAERALALWREQLPDDDEPANPDDWLSRQGARLLLGRALGPLITYRSKAGLPYLERIIRAEPRMIRILSVYLERLTDEHEGAAQETILNLLKAENLYISPWQAMWLFQPLSRMTSLSEREKKWAANHVGLEMPDVVRAAAARLLAKHASISPEQLVRIYSSIEPASRPDVVAALAQRCEPSDPQLNSVKDDSPFHRWIVDSLVSTA